MNIPIFILHQGGEFQWAKEAASLEATVLAKMVQEVSAEAGAEALVEDPELAASNRTTKNHVINGLGFLEPRPKFIPTSLNPYAGYTIL